VCPRPIRTAVSGWARGILLATALCLLVGVRTVSGAVPVVSCTRSVNLAWDANVEPDITGYRLYYGTRSGEYTESVDTGNVTTTRVDGLACGSVYYFALTAWNQAGLESDFSNEVEYLVPVDPLPSAGIDTLSIGAGQSLKVAVAELLANDTGPDPERLDVVGVSPASMAGAAVSLGGGWIFYQPIPDQTGQDSFAYTLADGLGGVAIGTVIVNLTTGEPSGGTLNQLGPPVVFEGKVQVQFLGIPNRLYAILRKTSIISPTWAQIGTAMADATGLVEFVDANPPAETSFYRTLDLMSP